MKIVKLSAKLSILSFKLLEITHSFFNGIVQGFWLGVMNENSLDLADELYYKRTKDYTSEGYNNLGLYRWEEAMIKRYFSKAKNILVIAAGGGRETMALNKVGYNVDSYECNQALVDFGNSFLEKNGINNIIKYLPRNTAPDEKKKYDGIIIGCAAYAHIRGYKMRLSLLNKLSPFLNDSESPLMISFLTKGRTSGQERIIKCVSNFFRLFTNKEKTELGDRLIPLFVHYFNEEEIKGELMQADYVVKDYSDIDYGCLVATCRQSQEL